MNTRIKYTENANTFFRFSLPLSVLVNYRYGYSSVISAVDNEISDRGLKDAIKKFSFPKRQSRDLMKHVNFYLLEVSGPMNYDLLAEYLGCIGFRYATSYELLFALKDPHCQMYLATHTDEIDCISVLGDRGETDIIINLSKNTSWEFSDLYYFFSPEELIQTETGTFYLVASDTVHRAPVTKRDSIDNGSNSIRERQTIQNLKRTFEAENLTFTGLSNDFWDMQNDPEIQKAIAAVMKRKLDKRDRNDVLIPFGFVNQESRH